MGRPHLDRFSLGSYPPVSLARPEIRKYGWHACDSWSFEFSPSGSHAETVQAAIDGQLAVATRRRSGSGQFAPRLGEVVLRIGLPEGAEVADGNSALPEAAIRSLAGRYAPSVWGRSVWPSRA